MSSREDVYAEYNAKSPNELNKVRCDEIRDLVRDKLGIIDKIGDYTMQCVLLMSLIDSFAQEDNNYGMNYKKNKPYSDEKGEMGSKKSFCNFIKSYSPDTLKQVWETPEFIMEMSKDTELGAHVELRVPGWSAWLNVRSLNSTPEYAQGYPRVLTAVKEYYANKGIKWKPKTYVDMFYILRCKLIHEMAKPVKQLPKDEQLDFISYQERTVLAYDVEDNLRGIKVRELLVPYGFIRKVAEMCIMGYIDKCEELGKDPYANYMKRLKKNNYNGWVK